MESQIPPLDPLRPPAAPQGDFISLLPVLCCPECRKPLAEVAGALSCGVHRFPVVNGVPRFVDGDKYVGNFSFEWQVHRRTQFDEGPRRESEETFVLKTGFDLSRLRGKLVLDVGVGAGRFADVAARNGAEVVGIDLSYAVNAAKENLARYPSARVLQADVFRLPFRDESFDYIFSIGVLHHTPDCRAAFAALPRLLKKGGEIAIWVYSGYSDNLRINDFYRRLARRLPQRWLYALSHLAVPGYYLYKVPVLRSGLHHYLPVVSMHPDRSWRVLDTFDWYSPTYQSHHTYPEVYGWFREAGLTDIELLPGAVSVRGRRP